MSVCIHVRLPQSVWAIMRMTKISKELFLTAIAKQERNDMLMSLYSYEHGYVHLNVPICVRALMRLYVCIIGLCLY